jgi:ubiquinone/menaquinone biosynthesis C-methylase UbiE
MIQSNEQTLKQEHNQAAFIQNMLYRDPALYEQVYKDYNAEVSKRMFDRYIKRSPTSILDIGCGTGRDLYDLSTICSDCVGIDYQSNMIDYANLNYPHLNLQVGDMR